jgi:hypothetical protein
MKTQSEQSLRLWREGQELRGHSQELFDDTRSLCASSQQLRLHAAMLKEHIQRALGKLRFTPPSIGLIKPILSCIWTHRRERVIRPGKL